ncbi:putative lipid-binding protein At4g00165 [Magnolia sinica]|uniref:putative lipid-binding protein At4g00165 n=1 Tax=Magnolia sinica TaxID=86752 RepID=UPI00265ACD99|nr:putative lipid-binding protein At4g00165 [Magnolia sinica]
MADKILATYCILSLLSFIALAHGCNTCGTPPAIYPPPPAILYPPPSAICPPAPAPYPASCPIDTLKLGVCADLLGGLVGVVVGTPPYSKCCTLLEGIADLEAAVCLCTVIKVDVLGIINLDVPVALSLLVSACGRKVPDGFKCA